MTAPSKTSPKPTPSPGVRASRPSPSTATDRKARSRSTSPTATRRKISKVSQLRLIRCCLRPVSAFCRHWCLDQCLMTSIFSCLKLNHPELWKYLQKKCSSWLEPSFHEQERQLQMRLGKPASPGTTRASQLQRL